MRRNLLLLLIFVIAVLVVVSGARRLLSFKSTAAKVEQSEKRLARLREENEQLRRELEYKQSPEFIEREIREKLGLAKPGEAIVILPKENDESLDELGTSSTNDERKNEPNYIKWWRLFFGG